MLFSDSVAASASEWIFPPTQVCHSLALAATTEKLHMKIISLLLVLIMAVEVGAATPNEVDAWKRAFPTVGVEMSFGLRRMVSQYEQTVMQATSANIYATTRMLRERAEKDLADAAQQLARTDKGPSAQEAKEKRDWLNNRLLPYVRKMG